MYRNNTNKASNESIRGFLNSDDWQHPRTQRQTEIISRSQRR